MALGYGRTADNNFGTAKFIVSANLSDGATHTTIASALTSASSGDTIFIRDGSYTENLTLKAGVNLTSFGSSASANNTGNVKIIGKATFTGTGTVSIYGIELQTNSDYFLVVSGSSASVVYLTNCYLNCSNNTGINYTSSSSSSAISIWECNGNLGTTGIGLFTGSGAGGVSVWYSSILNSGGSTTATTLSSGAMFIFGCNMATLLSTTGTCALAIMNSQIDVGNNTALTHNGSGGGTVANSRFNGGSASAISVAGNLTITNCAISSSNTNAITGAGTVQYGGLSFPATSTINTSTQVPFPFGVNQGGTGLSSVTAYGLVCGGTTTGGPLQTVADVATGQVLVSGGVSALPAFSATPTVTSITFGSGTALSVFEQGTFNPTIRGSSTAGSVTMTTQIGRYQKEGRIATVMINADWSTLGGATGSAQCNNLPYTVVNVSNATYISFASASTNALATASGAVPFMQANTNTASAQINYYLGSTGQGNAGTITASNGLNTILIYETT